MTDGGYDDYDCGFADGLNEGHADGWDDCKKRAIALLQQDADEAERFEPQTAYFLRYAITVLRDEL